MSRGTSSTDSSSSMTLSYAERIKQARDKKLEPSQLDNSASSTSSAGRQESARGAYSDDRSRRMTALSRSHISQERVTEKGSGERNEMMDQPDNHGKIESNQYKEADGEGAIGFKEPLKQSALSSASTDPIVRPNGNQRTSSWADLTSVKLPLNPSDLSHSSNSNQIKTSPTDLDLQAIPVPSIPSAMNPSSTSNPSTNALASSSSSPAAEKTGKPAVNKLPATNIWQFRKSQMASTAHSASASSSSKINSANKSVFSALTSAPIAKQVSKNAQKAQQNALTLAKKGNEEKVPSKVMTKGALKSVSGKRSEPLPSLGDASAWPEVAQAVVAHKNAHVGQGERKVISVTREADEPIPSGSSKVTRKGKRWTPIPAVEMQEALEQAQRQKKADQVAEAKSRKAALPENAKNTVNGVATTGKKGASGAGVTGKLARPGSNPPELSKKAKGAAAKAEKASIEAARMKAVDAATAKSDVTSNIDNSTIAAGAGTNRGPTGSKSRENSNLEGSQTTDVLGIDRNTDNKDGTDTSTTPKQSSLLSPRAGTTTQTCQSSASPGVSNIHFQQQGYGRGSNGNSRGSRGARGGRGGRGGGSGSSNTYNRTQSDSNNLLLSPNSGRSMQSLQSNGAGQNPSRKLAESMTASYGFGQQYYGSPYHYPILSGGFPPSAEGAYDVYGQAALAGGTAPFPRPITQISGLDGLQSWILGQLEYYFSMQNLAMDFFLRQQMDNQGWVDINMISSFNRIKSLTADASVVKEVAGLSSILQIKEEHIRLADGQWRQWVLPDAKQSPIPDDGTEAPYTGEMPFGMPGDMTSQARDKLVGDIHRDVMRSASQLQAASGLTKSVPGGLEAESAASQTATTDEANTESDTPATSLSEEPDPHDKLEIILRS